MATFTGNKVSIELKESLPWAGGRVYKIRITPCRLKYTRTTLYTYVFILKDLTSVFLWFYSLLFMFTSSTSYPLLSLNSRLSCSTVL